MKSFFIMVLMVVGVFGDYVAKYKMGEDIYTFYYKDKAHMKLQMADDVCKNGILYKIGKKLYSVSFDENGKLLVMDLSKLQGMMNQMGFLNPDDTAQSESIKDIYNIIKTSQKKKVGGYSAYKWILEDKQTKEQTVVFVTNNKTANKVTQAMLEMFSALSQDQENISLEIEKGYAIIKGEGIELLGIEKKSFPSSVYKLPNKHSTIARQCRKQKKKTTSAPKTPSSKYQEPKEEVSPEDIQKAADMLKGFF